MMEKATDLLCRCTGTKYIIKEDSVALVCDIIRKAVVGRLIRRVPIAKVPSVFHSLAKGNKTRTHYLFRVTQ